MNTNEMQLYHHNLLLGTLTCYSYETPWASAWLTALDPTAISRYAAIDAFLRWSETISDELSDAQADVRYEQELAARGLDEALVQSFWSGWQVCMPDGEYRTISLYAFEDAGSLTWRW